MLVEQKMVIILNSDPLIGDVLLMNSEGLSDLSICRILILVSQFHGHLAAGILGYSWDKKEQTDRPGI
jgi:hypothetical protein